MPSSPAADNPALLRTWDVGDHGELLEAALPGTTWSPSLPLFLGAAKTSSFSPSTSSDSLTSLLRGRRRHPALYQLCLSLILQAETDGERELLHPCLAGFSYITLPQILIFTWAQTNFWEGHHKKAWLQAAELRQSLRRWINNRKDVLLFHTASPPLVTSYPKG